MIIEYFRNKQFILPLRYVLFIIFLIGTSLIGLEPKNFNVFFQYIFISILAVFIYNMIRLITLDEKEIEILSFILLLIAGIGSITLLTDYFEVTKFNLLFSTEIYKESLSGRGAGLLGGETNFTAARLSVLLPFAFYLIYHGKYIKGLRFFYIGIIGTIILAIVLTGSRMGMLALVQVLLFVFFHEFRKSSIVTKLFSFFALIAIIGFLYYSSSVVKNPLVSVERYKSLTSIAELNAAGIESGVFDESLLNRFILFWVGIELIRKDPLTGVGVGNAKYIAPKYVVTRGNMKYLHNTFLDIGSENGLPMLIVFILFSFMIVYTIWKSYRRTHNEYLYYFLIGFWVMYFCWLFLSDFSNKLYWNFFLPMGLYLQTKQIDK